MKVSDEQIYAALVENEHPDIAEALAAKLEPEGDEAPKDMNQGARSGPPTRRLTRREKRTCSSPVSPRRQRS